MSQVSLPPGNMGLPLVGETLAYLNDGFGFVAERTARHGPVFKTSILGRKAAVIVGPDASALWTDAEYIERAGAMPPPVLALFGGDSLPVLDGEEHRRRKAQLMAGFDRDSLVGYLPGLEHSISRRLKGWLDGEERILIPELRCLAIEAIGANIVGLEPGDALDALVRDYAAVTNGVAALPINLPGTTFRRALEAKDRLLRFLRSTIESHQARALGSAPPRDGLGRILGAPGAKMDVSELTLELHHIFIAGYIIFAELAAAILQLTEHPEIQAALNDEVRELPAEGLTAESLAALPQLSRFVMEVKRTCPVIPCIFGKARREFEFAGHRIPRGWMVLWSVRSTHLDPATWTDPERFDPDRFSDDRAEHLRHPHAFAPQGPGSYSDHKCPGNDYATLFIKLFTIQVLRAASWQLPPQNLEYVWKLIPPEPKDGLRIRFTRT